MTRAFVTASGLLFLCATSWLYTVCEGKLARFKRQTVVSSNANSNGTADDVESSAAAHHWKTVDGIIGVNVSSAGNATGAGHANLTNNAYGSAGDKEINANGDVSALGQNSKSTSDIDAIISGNNQTVTNYQQGLASGTGDTQAQANSNTFMGNGNQHGTYNGNNSEASAGATGSIGSNSEVVLSQNLSWDSILAQLVGSATAQGVYNAQANMDLGAGTQENGVEVNGLVSGDNSGGGMVNANVNGNGNMDNSNHELSGNLSGSVNGSGQTNLVGASNLQSNNSGKITDISSFGDTKIDTNGQSGASMNGQRKLQSAGGVSGNILSNGTADGANKNMTVNNGLKVDENGENTLAMGNGGLQGSGTQATNGTLTVDTKYNGNGDANVVVNGDGESAASGYNTSSLDISANADLANTHGLANNGYANSAGVVKGEHSNMTGNSFLNLDGSGSSGNANMDAQGGGKGPSSALTSGTLELTDANNVKRNASVQGSVQADGDETSVRSISIVTDYGGKQSLSNYQNATSNSAGSSSAHATNAGVLKRKRRHTLEWLAHHPIPPAVSPERIII